ncbi:hypothetical protein Tco_0441188 [Tanacetum coccineum]
MCTRFTSLPKILAFITTGAEELLPPEGNVISLPLEVRPSTLFFAYDSSCLIMSITASTGVSLVSCPWSVWKWQYLDMSRDRLLPNIRGGCSKLLAAFSVARISLGLLDRLESSPWLGPRYGENLSLPFCPRLLSQEDFLDLSKFSLRSLGVPLVATSLSSIKVQVFSIKPL